MLAGAVACQYARVFIQPKSVRGSAIPLLRAFSFRLLMAVIIRSAAFSYSSGSFAPFCIVLHIKVLAVLP